MSDRLAPMRRLRLPPVPIVAVAQVAEWILRGCPSCHGDLQRDRDSPPASVPTYTCLLCGRGAVAIPQDDEAREAAP